MSYLVQMDDKAWSPLAQEFFRIYWLNWDTIVLFNALLRLELSS